MKIIEKSEMVVMCSIASGESVTRSRVKTSEIEEAEDEEAKIAEASGLNPIPICTKT